MLVTMIANIEHCEPLAQLVEQQTHNLLVLGSYPRGFTMFYRREHEIDIQSHNYIFIPEFLL